MIMSPISNKDTYVLHNDTVVSFSHPVRISIEDPWTEVLRSGMLYYPPRATMLGVARSRHYAPGACRRQNSSFKTEDGICRSISMNSILISGSRPELSPAKPMSLVAPFRPVLLVFA